MPDAKYNSYRIRVISFVYLCGGQVQQINNKQDCLTLAVLFGWYVPKTIHTFMFLLKQYSEHKNLLTLKYKSLLCFTLLPVKAFRKDR